MIACVEQSLTWIMAAIISAQSMYYTTHFIVERYAVEAVNVVENWVSHCLENATRIQLKCGIPKDEINTHIFRIGM